MALIAKVIHLPRFCFRCSLLEYDIARFVADAEAIYSYEGTKKINSLIVGRAITGESAFV